MGVGETVAVGSMLVWCVAFLYFAGADIIKGIRSKKMSGYSMHSATAANISSGTITLGGNTTTSVTVNSPMVATDSLMLGDMDVGETLKMFLFYLQSRHPEVFEEYKAIKKIKES